MSDLVPARKMIQVEETKPAAAVTQSVMSRVGQAVNFININHVYQKDWSINRRYNVDVGGPLHQFIDGPISYTKPFEVLDFQLYVGSKQGDSGITEIDILWKPENAPASEFETIFSTTPKFDYTAETFASIRSGQTKPGFTAPVLSKTLFDAHDVLRLDIIQAVGGQPIGVFAKLFMRPR